MTAFESERRSKMIKEQFSVDKELSTRSEKCSYNKLLVEKSVGGTSYIPLKKCIRLG